MKGPKLVPVYSVKAYRRSTDIAPLNLNLKVTTHLHLARWKWVVNLNSSRFNPGKEPRFPLKRKLSGSQSRTASFTEEKSFCPGRDLNRGSLSLYRSHYTNFAIPAPNVMSTRRLNIITFGGLCLRTVKGRKCSSAIRRVSLRQIGYNANDE